jgi:hypothetical protein
MDMKQLDKKKTLGEAIFTSNRTRGTLRIVVTLQGVDYSFVNRTSQNIPNTSLFFDTKERHQWEEANELRAHGASLAIQTVIASLNLYADPEMYEVLLVETNDDFIVAAINKGTSCEPLRNSFIIARERQLQLRAVRF